MAAEVKEEAPNGAAFKAAPTPILPRSKEEVEAILGTIRRERKEAMKLLESEGGDLNDILERVRRRTLDVREQIHEEYRKREQELPDSPFSTQSGNKL